MQAENYREHPFYYSYKINGEMIVLTKKKLLKTLPKGTKAYKDLKK